MACYTREGGDENPGNLKTPADKLCYVIVKAMLTAIFV